MNMKSSLCVLALLIASLAFTTASPAATNQDELDAIVTLLGVQKRKVIEELVNIPAEQAANFWKVYAAFEVEQKANRKQRIMNYERFADSYDTMTEEAADQIAAAFFTQRQDQEKLLQKYHGEMKTATNAKLALQFYQAETYLLTLARAHIMEQLPTYGQIQKFRSMVATPAADK